MRRPSRGNGRAFVTRGVFVRRGKILLAQLKREDWFFLPGGEVELHETAAKALRREIWEELRSHITGLKLIGAMENHFTLESKRNGSGERHEVNFIFTGFLTRKTLSAQESHLTFTWHPLLSLPEIRFFPESLGRAILRWRETKVPFLLIKGNG